MNALLASILLVAAAATGTSQVGRDAVLGKPEQIRALAKLPTVNLNFRLNVQSSDLTGIKTNATSTHSEAELRNILKTTPTNAVAWCELGMKVSGRALKDYLHVECLQLEDVGKLVQEVRAGRITANDVRSATRLMDEALECCNKSVQFSPRYLDAYVQRAFHRMVFQSSVQALQNTLDDKPFNLLSMSLSLESLADFQQFARLCPDSPEAQTTFASYTMLWEAMAKNIAPDFTTGWGKSISDKSLTDIRENYVRLQTLAASTDTKRAATACEGLGVINLMFDGATADTAKHFRRAIILDPTRDRAWDMLAGVQLSAQRLDALLATCAERVKAADTSRNRFLLAKAHEKLNQLDKADEQLDIILKREPDNFSATAGKAVVLLRRGDDAKAAAFLQRANTLATDSVSAEQRADLAALQAIHAALSGDRDAAKRHLDRALKLDDTNNNARAVLRLLES